MKKVVPLVSFITVNYNQTGSTLELIASIYRHVTCTFEIIVVDNHSKISPLKEINRTYPEVKVIVSGVNRGFAGGNNLGLSISKGRFLFFINNDAVLTKGAVVQLLSSFENPNIGAVSPMICYFPTLVGEGKDIIQYAGATQVNSFTGRNVILGEGQIDQGQYRRSKSTFYTHGAAMMVSRSVIDKVGSMSESYFLYYEELDWCERIRRAGYTILFQPAAKIYHKESVSVGKFSPMKTYYLTRNRILFMSKNKEVGEFIVFSLFLFFIVMPWKTLKYIFKREGAQLSAFYRAILWNYSVKNKKDSSLRSFSEETSENQSVILVS